MGDQLHVIGCKIAVRVPEWGFVAIFLHLYLVADDIGQGNTSASTYIEKQQLHLLEGLDGVRRVKVQSVVITNLVGQCPLVLSNLLLLGDRGEFIKGVVKKVFISNRP